MFNKIFTNRRTLLRNLLNGAVALGLRGTDIKSATEMLEYNEFGECFNIIVTQLYEYSIPITADYYRSIKEVGAILLLEQDEYSFAKKLIK